MRHPIFSSTAVQTEVTILPQEDFVAAVLKENCREAPKKLVEIIASVLKDFPLLSEAAIVELANQLSITMFGKEVSNAMTNTPGRKSYNLHPYRKAGSGAVCMAAYADLSGETYVLFGEKAKAPNLLILLGGYFQPFPLAGHKEGVEKLTPEQKDQIEEAIIAGVVDAYQALIKAMRVEAADAPVIKWDVNVEACAKRELEEEANLKGVKPEFLMEQSKFPDTNPDLHSINLSYLFDCGVHGIAPEVKPGSDIKALRWINIKEIEIRVEGDEKVYSYQGVPIRKDHGPILEVGIKNLIEKKVSQTSDGLLTLETLERKIALLESRVAMQERSLLKEKPSTYLGEMAHDYLSTLYKVAESIRRAEERQTYFDDEELRKIINRESVEHSDMRIHTLSMQLQ
jgi:8-oxo-dGTP pyrophosphatase MutT (NUDIX family)